MHSLIKGMIAAPIMLLALSACEPQSPESPMPSDTGSTDAKYSAQELFDRGKIVCKDGYAYIFGWTGSYHGGPWAVPYMRDGKQGRCQVQAKTPPVEFEGT